MIHAKDEMQNKATESQIPTSGCSKALMAVNLKQEACRKFLTLSKNVGYFSKFIRQ